MIAPKAMTDAQVNEELATCKQFTSKELNSFIAAEAELKYCPSIKDKCLGHRCAMFVIDRPRTDWRFLEARCTYAGTRTIASIYGEPKDKDFAL